MLWRARAARSHDCMFGVLHVALASLLQIFVIVGIVGVLLSIATATAVTSVLLARRARACCQGVLCRFLGQLGLAAASQFSWQEVRRVVCGASWLGGGAVAFAAWAQSFWPRAFLCSVVAQQ